MPNPSKYTDELAQTVLDHLWSGATWPEIEAREPGVKKRTFQDWCRARPELAADYKTAIEAGAGVLIDQVIPLLDDRESDPDASSRKARAWGRLEVAKRKAPHLYGDKVTLAGDAASPLAMGITVSFKEPSA